MAWIDGASGSFSMLAKRKASGQEVNDSTLLGDRLVGTSNTPPSYDGGVTGHRGPPPRRTSAATPGRVRERPEVVEVVLQHEPAVRQLAATASANDEGCSSADPARDHDDGDLDRRQRIPGVWMRPSSNVLASISGSHLMRMPSRVWAEPVAHVGVEGGRVEGVEWRLRGEVGDRLLDGRKRAAPPAGSGDQRRRDPRPARASAAGGRSARTGRARRNASGDGPRRRAARRRPSSGRNRRCRPRRPAS